MTPPTLRALSLGEVLDVSFSLGRQLYPTLLVIVLVTQALPSLMSIYIESSGGFLESPLFYIGNVVVSVILAMLSLAAITFVVSEYYLGRELTAIAALVRSMGLVWRLLAISILSSLLIALGMLLLVVPGIIALCGLALGSVVAVVESAPTATAAMGRSWSLTKGFRLKVFWVFFLGLIILSLPGFAFGMVLGIADATEADGMMVPLVLLVQTVISMLLYPFFLVMLTVVYYDLRVRKEGLDLELLATSLAAE